MLLPATAAGMAYLVWRRRWMAAAHWLATLAFGLALTKLLGATVDVVRQLDASSGFGFPSVSVTMATITFGFFAVLIARELPGRTRVWPYLVAGVVVNLIGFSRIYLGAHWLSDVIGGMLFGTFWLLVLGIAYRRRFNRSFWVKPAAWLFYGVFALAAMWYAPRNIAVKLERFEPAQAAPVAMDAQGWWATQWAQLPARRNEFDDDQRWPLDVQVAGPLAPLQAQLEAHGWTVQPQAGWQDVLLMLDKDTGPADLPVLPATLDTRVEALLMVRPGATPDERYVLRLWPAPATLQPGAVPLWLGSAQTLRHQRHFSWIGMWHRMSGVDPALNALKAAVQGLPQAEAVQPETGLPVLRLKTRQESP
ncbi:MAG: Phosphatidylglycerophosphatase B [Stenotrophomonas maltophilia]|uniref:Phosphatidylglycerophosphatase B n=1 Tax=Stenotrophomonas maltophilia TaxID=40324 RepID=A0A7V8JLE5_STEMA|nr:MAG: Phosphatidylglycerophosphatase B [Stenotrophomonas maltophilia]